MLAAPPVAGAKFLRKWNGPSLAMLLEYLRTTMPSNNPGYLGDGEMADIVAYMLATSGVPPGSAALRPERHELAAIVIALPPE